MSAHDALERLKDGNRRFVTGHTAVSGTERTSAIGQLTQHPFAIILGCSDSRVPPEVVFDQGPGSLFVVRVAGNIAAPSEVGSIEFAAAELGTRLVVVLGHTRCGAVDATLRALEMSASGLSPDLLEIVRRVQPSVEPLLGTDADRDTVLERAVRANIIATASRLRHESGPLAGLGQTAGLRVVGALYRLETGVVEFFGDVA